ncbi:Restriction of telomere capping protein 5 [Basidiobolus ranarum]|uniref:Restriction of telomere capping protein 5 n=1 Tax=Basidiobolus ranarum TaxID=34480 RepID=A0ABR2WL74_9FUNG
MGNKHSSHSRESHSRKTLNENSHNNTQTSLAGEGSNGHNVSNVELDNIAKVFKSLKKQVDGVDIIPEETFQIYIGLPKELNLPHILYEPFCKLPNILKGIPAKATSGLTYDCFQTSTAFYCEQHKDFLAGRKERIVMFFDSLAEPVSEGEETKVSLGHIYDVLAGTFWVMKTYFANQIQDALSGDETHQPVTVPTHEPAIDLVVAQLAIYQRKAQRDDKNFSAFSSNEIISRSVFEHFVERNIPMFLVVWRAYIYAKFYLGEPDGPRVGRHIFGGRDILPNYDFSSEILKLGDACMLSCFLPSSVT